MASCLLMHQSPKHATEAPPKPCRRLRRDRASRSFPAAPAPPAHYIHNTCRPTVSDHDPNNGIQPNPAPVPQICKTLVPSHEVHGTRSTAQQISYLCIASSVPAEITFLLDCFPSQLSHEKIMFNIPPPVQFDNSRITLHHNSY